MLVNWGRTGLKKDEKKMCERKNCPTCKDKVVFLKGSQSCQGSKVSFSLKWVCKATLVIYFLRCSKCELGYVGATSRELSKRYSEHVGKIKSSSLEIQTVHLHFKQSEKGCVPQIGILEKVKEETLFEIEKKYIQALKHHFNVKDVVYIRKDGIHVEKVTPARVT